MQRKTQNDVARWLPASSSMNCFYSKKQWLEAVEKAFAVEEPKHLGALVAMESDNAMPFIFARLEPEGDDCWRYGGRRFSGSPDPDLYYHWESVNEFGEPRVLMYEDETVYGDDK